MLSAFQSPRDYIEQITMQRCGGNLNDFLRKQCGLIRELARSPVPQKGVDAQVKPQNFLIGWQF